MEIKFHYFKKMNLRKEWVMFTLAVLLPLFILTACKKEDTGGFNTAKPSVFQYISENKQLIIYQAALKKAGMFNAETFSTGGPFTVFAAVDAAFIREGLTLDSINRYDPQALAMALKYGIAHGRLSSSSLVGFYAEDITTLNTLYKPNIVKNYYGVFFNGIPIPSENSADLNDGVVHVLDRVPLPPAGSLVDVIKQTPDLTLMAAAIKALGLETQYSTVLIGGAGSFYYCLLAPTDSAFKVLGYPDVAAINDDANTNPSKLSGILRTSTLTTRTPNQKTFTASFIGGYASDVAPFRVAADGVSILTSGNATPVHIIRPDIVATNGVLQVVDQVPTPK